MGSVTENEDIKSFDYDPPIFPNYSVVDLKGRQVDRSKTGMWKAAPFIYAINLANFQVLIGVYSNLMPYLTGTMHQPTSKAATIITNLYGTSYLVSILGGFLADSYIGALFTICAGEASVILGLAALILSTAFSNLKPDPCAPTGPCKPATGRYVAPLYLALYTIAFGTGLVNPSNVSLGGDQFDEWAPKEKKESVNFFVWFFFFVNVGLFVAYTLGVYIQDGVSRSWGYSFSLMLYITCFLFFILGVTKFRLRPPTGSFLTRTAHVVVASIRKWKIPTAADPEELYSTAVTQLNVKLRHTSILRFFDRAAIIDEEDRKALAAGCPDPWRLCTISQVEESKRLVQFVPVWITLAPVTLVSSQIATFEVQQGKTLDRKLGPHFEIPPASLSVRMTITSLLVLPVSDRIIIPFVKRYTKCPYGFAPLQRLGASLVFSIITMVCAALVERKRLTYVRELHLQALPLGAYVLPMKFWYFVPQFFAAARVESYLYVSSYQFFYHEAMENTRSVGSSFTYSASALGYFFSTIIVNITNHVTKNAHGGSWLNAQLNNGGLEKFYWLLTVFITVDFILFLVAAHFYQYKYDWYQLETSKPETEDTVLSSNQSSLRRSKRVGPDPATYN